MLLRHLYSKQVCQCQLLHQDPVMAMILKLCVFRATTLTRQRKRPIQSIFFTSQINTVHPAVFIPNSDFYDQRDIFFSYQCFPILLYKALNGINWRDTTFTGHVWWRGRKAGREDEMRRKKIIYTSPPSPTPPPEVLSQLHAFVHVSYSC